MDDIKRAVSKQLIKVGLLSSFIRVS